ncbi:hypothetical protein JY651_29920 [Pyxidicoccus parkwayensis]|uniref:Protein kinase domain-containing protein n=1 Tax=Pyxidicoccus parkwayensis TaxID=2813578 RepID=A0ABX7NTP8_9BACT|nr:hypothetical protein [Pyxidicoccus parkwaysis]QSQ19523.1 hypothetical protein JY651_29920 [Pyxidicoccus parkwaysis]
MKLPSDSDYQAALQHPRQAFADPELRAGVPEVMGSGALAGLPRPRAGNFATVYKLRCGERDFAVRCFTRPIQQDQAVRYAEVIRHLSMNWMSSSVEVAFLSRGIQVQGHWFPIVKMEWVQGESLAAHVDKHHASPKALFDLAAAWLQLLEDLRRARVAHGDLQHGNVVVTPEGLRLVDYDGMFVPALAGRTSHERGHANYQHPDRTPDFFDERMDSFSAWVVWASLVALAHEPSLWKRFHGGDDCLLFRKKDFVERERSALFKALLASPHAPVRAVASFMLGTLLPSSPRSVPPLDGAAIAGLEVPRVMPALPPEAKAPPSQTAASELARFMVPELSAPAARGAVPLEDRQVANGILLAGGLSAVLSVAMSPMWLMGLGVTGGLGWAWARSAYQRTRGLERLQTVDAALATTRKDLEEAEARLQQLREDRARVEQEARSQCAELLSALEAMSSLRGVFVQKARDAYQAKLAGFTEQRKALSEQESHARQSLEGEQQAWEAELQRRLANLTSADRAHAEALRMLQEEHVADVLRREPIDKARVRGVGLTSQAIDLLRSNGVLTAAGIVAGSTSNIQKLPTHHQSLLLEWRAGLEQWARESMPTQLPEAQQIALEKNWLEFRARTERELEALQAERARRTEALAARFAALREALSAEESEVAELLWRKEPDVSGFMEQESLRLTRELKARTMDLDAAGLKVEAARRACASLHWRREELEREQSALGTLRFSRYLTLLLKDNPE